MNSSRIQESSSGKSPIGDKPLRFIPSATTLSLITFSHKIIFFPQNFRGNPGTTLASIRAHGIVKKQHKEKKSSSGKSPIGRQAFNGHIPSATTLSLITFITKKHRPHKLHYFVVHCSNKFSTCSIIGWDTKDRGDMN